MAVSSSQRKKRARGNFMSRRRGQSWHNACDFDRILLPAEEHERSPRLFEKLRERGARRKKRQSTQHFADDLKFFVRRGLHNMLAELRDHPAALRCNFHAKRSRNFAGLFSARKSQDRVKRSENAGTNRVVARVASRARPAIPAIRKFPERYAQFRRCAECRVAPSALATRRGNAPPPGKITPSRMQFSSARYRTHWRAIASACSDAFVPIRKSTRAVGRSITPRISASLKSESPVDRIVFVGRFASPQISSHEPIQQRSISEKSACGSCKTTVAFSASSTAARRRNQFAQCAPSKPVMRMSENFCALFVACCNRNRSTFPGKAKPHCFMSSSNRLTSGANGVQCEFFEVPARDLQTVERAQELAG